EHELLPPGLGEPGEGAVIGGVPGEKLNLLAGRNLVGLVGEVESPSIALRAGLGCASGTGHGPATDEHDREDGYCNEASAHGRGLLRYCLELKTMSFPITSTWVSPVSARSRYR